MNLQTAHNKKYRFAIFASVFYFALAIAANAASGTLSLSPATGSFVQGSTFTVKVVANGSGTDVNAAEANLSFDVTALSVVKITKDTAFTLWTAEPSFSNTKGTINFGGGNPAPISGKANIVTITFRALKVGSTKVAFSSGSLLAADGKGTEILGDMLPATFEIKEKGTTTPGADTGSAGKAPAPVKISSKTHPDSEKWYNLATASFEWDIVGAVTGMKVSISTKENELPLDEVSTVTPSKTFGEIEDGISYVHVQMKNQYGWGQVAHRKFQVDTTPPDAFSASAVPADNPADPPFIRLEAEDRASGIDRYELQVDGKDVITIRPEDLKDNKFQLTTLEKGTYNATGRVFDKAGNVKEAKFSFEVTGAKAGTAQAEEDLIPVSLWQKCTALFTPQVIIIIILFMLIAYLVGRDRYKKKIDTIDHELMKTETKELRIKIEKIFSALRDEVEEQIVVLNNKPRLGESEKRAMDTIKDALDISEELLDKEVGDIEKLTK